MKRYSLIKSALLATLLAACGSGHSSGGHGSTAANDVEFIDGMVPHHQGALIMADMILQRGAKAELKTMAQQMKDTQNQEIAQLRAARQQLVGSSETPADMDPHMQADIEHMQHLSGADLDRRFLEDMIPHHAGAIDMAHRALPNLKRADLRTMAMSIVSSQAKEVGELQDMLSRY